MEESAQISIWVGPGAEPGRVKIVWGDVNGKWPLYRLFSRPLLRKAEAARSALGQLGTAYLQPRPNFDEAISRLAGCGFDLRKALFDDCLPEDGRAAGEALEWFESLTTDRTNSFQITVYANPSVPIPWGLVHEYGAGHHGDDPYAGFWAVRYGVAALYNEMVPRHHRMSRPAHQVSLLSALNQAAYETTHQHLDPAERDFITTFLDRPVGRAFTSRGCGERWQQVGDSDCLIYFFGHASGSELRFTETDLLTASSFRSLFRRDSTVVRRPVQPAYVLSFLNGCASVSGLDDENFMVATADRGFCGFIGAEAPVPDRFALLFGQELLYNLLVAGVPVRQAMWRLWQKHKPMALFYGCYAHPDFAMNREEEQPSLPNGFDWPNFHPGPEAGG
jgi:hypothetical protein